MPSVITGIGHVYGLDIRTMERDEYDKEYHIGTVTNFA